MMVRCFIAALSALALSACATATPERPASIFIHGWASDARVWAPTRDRLSAPGIAVTLPGQGQPAAPGMVSLQGFADTIEAARLAAQAQCIVLVAHSNGAYAAFEYLHRYPGHTAALIIVEGTFVPPFEDRAAFADQVAQVGATWPSIQQNPFGLESARPETATIVRQMFAATLQDTATQSLEALLPMTRPAPASVREPVLFILAQSPFWSEERLSALRQIAPQARFSLNAGVSHWLPLDAPQAVADAVQHEVSTHPCPER
ncbi:MAG: alpha/beta hydrolase [Hyphomonadaceae bacterium]|nr:alpha/beta hydrolase [Hyphomonadaceae bacterium]